MSILVNRDNGRIIGSYFEIDKNYTPDLISKIDLGLFKKEISTEHILDEIAVTAFKFKNDSLCITAKFNKNTLISIIMFISDSISDWNSWSVNSEKNKLNNLIEILENSNIRNCEKLSWGMANAYYEPRSACSYLRIEYISEIRPTLPEPMPIAPILP